MLNPPLEEAKEEIMSFDLNSVSLGLSEMENCGLNFVEYEASTGVPRHPLEYYECEGDYPIPSTTALEWLQAGSGIGIILNPGIYALKFYDTDLPSVQRSIRLASERVGQNESDAPIFGNAKGDYIALFEAPAKLRSADYNSILRNIQAPGNSGLVDLYWGPQVAIQIMNAPSNPVGLRLTGGWVNPPNLHPRAWAPMSKFLNQRPKMIGVCADREDRRQLAINHLRLLRANLKPTDDFRTLLASAAADLVLGLRMDPYEAVELLNLPLGRRGTGESFLVSISKHMSSHGKPSQGALLGICEDAIDGVSPLAVNLWEKEVAERELRLLVEVLSNLPPANDEDFILAEDFRVEACGLLGIVPAHINQKTFGKAITAAEKRGVQIRRDRLLHPVLGNVVIYRGLTAATLHTTLYWWKNKALSSRAG